MRLAIAAALLLAIPALAASFAVAPVNGDDYLPPKCATNPTTGLYFCIHYLPMAGRYEIPPAGVPADMARVGPVDTPAAFPLDAVVIRYAVLVVILTAVVLIVAVDGSSIDWRSALRSALSRAAHRRSTPR